MVARQLIEQLPSSPNFMGSSPDRNHFLKLFNFILLISKISDMHLKRSGYVDIESYYKFISNSLNQ